MLQVAKQLQAVCRENPAKSRPSCKKKKKSTTSETEATTDVAKTITDVQVLSDSDCEITKTSPVAMDNTLSMLAGLEGASS